MNTTENTFNLSVHSSNFSFQGVLFFIQTLLKDPQRLSVHLGRMRKQKNESDIRYYPDFGKHVVTYKDETLDIYIEKHGSPKAGERTIDYYKVINISSTKSMEFLKDFIKEAMTYFYDVILERETEKDDINCWIWDEIWEDLYKKKKRSMKSISLGGKETNVLNDMKKFLSKETMERYDLLGIPYKKNYLLEGLPGTGKTSLIYSLASELNYDIAILNFNRKLGDMEFMRAIQSIPIETILVLEDIDVLFQERKSSDEFKHSLTFSGLLNVLDGLGHQGKLITVMTTNYKNRLDKALIRPGRIDYMLQFDYATKEQIEHMFNRFITNQTERFDEFYKFIEKKRLKLTTAMLQQFLFLNIDEDNILDHMNELKEIVEQNKIEENTERLYT
jgi:mitochondrial chaperone BCS1